MSLLQGDIEKDFFLIYLNRYHYFRGSWCFQARWKV